MRSFVLSLVAMLAFAGVGAAQTTHPAGSKLPEVLRGASAEQTTKKQQQPAAKAVVQKASVARSAQRPAAAKHTTPQTLRGSRYGGGAPPPPPPAPRRGSPRPRRAAAAAGARYDEPAQPRPGERQLRRNAGGDLLVGRRLPPRRARQAEPLPARYAG